MLCINSRDGSQIRLYTTYMKIMLLFDWRNNKDLTGIDEIRILEHRFVCFKDNRIFLGVTVNLLGYLREVITLLYRVKLLLRCRRCHRFRRCDKEMIFDNRDAFDVACRNDYLVLV